MKKRTSACSSLGEKLNVGIRACRYERTPFRFAPGCGLNVWPASPPLLLLLLPALLLALPGRLAGLLCGVAVPEGDGAVAAGAWAVALFSPLNEGSGSTRKSQFGSTRAPSLVNAAAINLFRRASDKMAGP